MLYARAAIYLVCACNSRQLSASVVLIMNEVCHVFEVHQMSAYQHVSQGNKVTVVEVLNVHHSPRIFPSSGLLSINVHDHVRPNNSKRNTLLHPPVFLPIILFAVCKVRELIDLDLGCLDLLHDCLFEGLALLRCHGVCLGQHGDDVHLVMQLLHELYVQRLQTMT